MSSLSIKGGACIRNRMIVEGETPPPSETPTPTPSQTPSETPTSTPSDICEDCGYPAPTLFNGEYGCIEGGQELGQIVDCWRKEVKCKNADFTITCAFPWPTETPSQTPSATADFCDDCYSDEAKKPKAMADVGYGIGWECENGSEIELRALPCKNQPNAPVVTCGWCFDLTQTPAATNGVSPTQTPTVTNGVTPTIGDFCDDCISDEAEKPIVLWNMGYGPVWGCKNGSEMQLRALPCKNAPGAPVVPCSWCFDPTQTPAATGTTPVPTPPVPPPTAPPPTAPPGPTSQPTTQTPVATNNGDNDCDYCINDTAQKPVANGNGGWQCADGSLPVSTALPCKGTNYSLQCGWCFPLTPGVTITPVATPAATPDAECSACGFQSTENNCPDGQTGVLAYLYCSSAGKTVRCYQCPPSNTPQPTSPTTTGGGGDSAFPVPPTVGTYVLTSVNGVLQWTATENC